MNWDNKKVLVTGAGGFIGGHLTEKLVELGAKVRAFVRYNALNSMGQLELQSPYILERIEVIAGDLKDPESVRRAVKGMEIIFHLGAIIPIPYSYLDPRNVFETNAMGTINVLNAIREYGVELMIHTSSSEVYGTAIYTPIDEKHPLWAQSPYAASKIAADKLVESFYLSYNLPIATIRPFNTYGPRQSARAIIPTIITQALSGDNVFIGATHPIRDFVYVSDTAEGFIILAESKNAIGEVINIGSGNAISIGELVDKIIALIGKKVNIIFDATRIRPEKSEVEQLIADSRKAKELINWEPHVSLDDGLKKTIEWISQSLNLYKPHIYNV
jgi:NAD dependent epimerase/dehydratase